METHHGDDVILDLRALALYIQRGGQVEWQEPEPRGRKGLDRAHHRIVTVTIVNPARYDALRWKLMTDPRLRR